MQPSTISTQNPGDIIIMCPPEEMAKHLFEDYTIVWHDPEINSPENQLYVAQLMKFCQVKTFTEWDKASICLKGTKKMCHVITAGTNGELLVKEIGSLQNVSSISVFCLNKDSHIIWAKNYPKIVCVQTDINIIQQKILEFSQQNGSWLPAFAPTHKGQLNNLQRYLKVIPDFKNREQAQNDFVSLSREIYPNQMIADFEQHYNKENVLKWWENPESFLPKIVNNCLRVATSDSIQYSRLILQDLQEMIKEKYHAKSKDFSGVLYKQATLSEEEWQFFQDNVDRDIETHGFLSASKEKPSDAAITILVPKGPNNEELGFAEINDKEVLFNIRSRFTVIELEENPQRHVVLLYGAQSFRRFLAEENPVQEISIPGEISCISCKASDCKILFAALANPDKFYCKTCLPNFTNTNATPLLCVPISDHLNKITLPGFSLINKSPKIPFYGYRCSICQAKKKSSYFVCTQCDASTYCEDCFYQTSVCMNLNHAVIFETSPFSFWFDMMSEKELNQLKPQTDHNSPFNLATMFVQCCEYEKAIKFYKAYIKKHQNTRDENLGTCFSKAGAIYYHLEEYQKALKYFLKSLDIRKEIHGENHSDVAASCDNIACAYNSQGKENEALDYHLKSLHIKQAIFGENHKEIAVSYSTVAMAYLKQEEYSKALFYYLKSLAISEGIYGENHPQNATSYHNIACIYQAQEDYEKSIEYQLKSLKARKGICGDNHAVVADFWFSFGEAYSDRGEYDKAREYHIKCLEIRKILYGDSHKAIADSYSKIGSTYFSQGSQQFYANCLEFSKVVISRNNDPEVSGSFHRRGEIIYSDLTNHEKARECYLKCLKIRESIYGENHTAVADIYYSIGATYQNQRQSEKARENYSKCLDIRKAIKGENDLAIVWPALSVGATYTTQGEDEKAQEYYSKSMEIIKSNLGDKNYMIAAYYSSIGTAHFMKGECDKAIENHMKRLEMRKSLYGEDEEVALAYHDIGTNYLTKGENEKAKECYLKCLEISKLVYGESHHETREVQEYIELIPSVSQIEQFR